VIAGHNFLSYPEGIFTRKKEIGAHPKRSIYKGDLFAGDNGRKVFGAAADRQSFAQAIITADTAKTAIEAILNYTGAGGIFEFPYREKVNGIWMFCS
jgi:hypothetical protein